MDKNKDELLKYAMTNDIIDFDTIRKHYEMKKRKEYLEMHKSKIWKSTDEKWYTFVPDNTKSTGKRLIKRQTEIELENFLVDFYKKYEEPQTIEKTYKEWIQRKLKFGEITKQTADRYETDFYKCFKGYENKDICLVTIDFLDDFIIDSITKYNMKSKAWSNLRTIIRGMFLFAKKKGYTNIDIVSYISELDISRNLFNREKKPLENVIYTKKETETIVDYISTSKSLNDIAILFAIYTGMRVGEIVALKWEDISEDYIHVNRMQERFKDENGKMVYRIRNFPKTEAGIRDVVIVKELKAVIKRLRIMNPFTEYLFEKNGECIHKHSVCTRLYNLCDKFGFPHKGMHAFRRYYATTLINAGVEKAIVTSQMGHTDFNTTMQHYYKNNSTTQYVVDVVTAALSS